MSFIDELIKNNKCVTLVVPDNLKDEFYAKIPKPGSQEIPFIVSSETAMNDNVRKHYHNNDDIVRIVINKSYLSNGIPLYIVQPASPKYTESFD